MGYVHVPIKKFVNLYSALHLESRFAQANKDPEVEVNPINNSRCHLRIEIHILSLHWMMKNISYFNVCEARRASRKH